VCCNYGVLRDRVIDNLKQELGDDLNSSTVLLPPTGMSLYTTIHTQLGDDQTDVLLVLGLESVSSLDDMLRTINQMRDEFRKRHQFPMVFFVNDELLGKLRRFAPDFTSWAATPIRFEMKTTELRELLQAKTDALFAEILDTQSMTERRPDFHATLGEIWDYSSYEFRCAIRELQDRGIDLEEELDASLAFVAGLDDYASDRMMEAIAYFQASLKYWQSQTDNQPIPSSDFPPIPASPNMLRQGVLLYYIGLCYLRLAERTHPEHRRRWHEAKSYFQRCLNVFELAQREDLMAQFIGQLAEVLQRLEAWDELEEVAKKSQHLHETYGSPMQMACDYGFLTRVAEKKKQWIQASQYARIALWQLDEAKKKNDTQENLFPWLLGQIYRLTLALVLRQQGDEKTATKQLNLAREELNIALENSDYRYDALRYIRLMRGMRSLYFRAGLYLEAFYIRQRRRSVEQQYGLRAFVGAERLQPQRQASNPVFGSPVPDGSVALEITASGRERDVNNLISRISRPDHKITVIHGPSGVGKSSTVNAGLVPALQQQAIGDQIAVPVVLSVYTDWIGELTKTVTENSRFKILHNSNKIGKDFQLLSIPQPFPLTNSKLKHGVVSPASPINSTAAILQQLQENGRNNIITVLVFDQFEEFLFSCVNPTRKQEFDRFLRDCLNVAFVKVILSLREDYLHHLLEFKHLGSVEPINQNILDKNIRYELKNFSREDAKTVIQRLTARNPELYGIRQGYTPQIGSHLEPELIDAIVEDLSAELGEVRPIELQVVGAQLQDERIVSLEKYQQYRPNKLIERYIRELIQDCGKENEQAALLVLYLLTDENKGRPFKTRAELATELEELENVEKLELVLEILVHSGLVVLFPDVPERYQLIHDYLVDLIRCIQQAELSLQEQVKQLRQQMQNREQELARLRSELRQNQQQAKQQQTQLQPGADLLTELRELRKREEINRTISERLVAELEQQKLQGELLEKEKQQLNQAKVNRILKKALGASIFGILALSISIGMAFYQGRRTIITATLAASASSEALFTLGHDLDAVAEGVRAGYKLQTIYPPDLQTQERVKTALYQAVYGMGTREVNRITGHTGDINCIAFSPDNSLIASASNDYTIKLWQANGKELATLPGHKLRVNSVAFSPDGKKIVSGSADKLVKLWDIQGNLIRTFTPHQDIVSSVTFSPDGEIIASGSIDQTIRFWDSQGQIIKTIQTNDGGVRSLAWSPDGEILASANNNGTVKFWNRDGKLLATGKRHKDPVLVLAWAPDGQTLVSGGFDQKINLWQRDGKWLRTLSGHRRGVTGISFTHDGKTIVSSSVDKTIKLWDVDGVLRETIKISNSWINTVSFSRDGETLALGSRDAVITLWRWQYAPLKKISAHDGDINKLSISPQGDLIASAGKDGSAKIWDIQGKFLNRLTKETSEVFDVSFSPNGKMLTSATKNGEIKLWSRDGNLIKILQGHTQAVYSVSWSPDGNLLASASGDQSIKLWNSQGEEITTLLGHTDPVNWVSFSPDGKTIASASDDKTVKLWSRNGKLIKTLEGHNRSVFAVVWSSDGDTIASTSIDGTVRLWDKTGKLQKIFRSGGEDSVNVGFIPVANSPSSDIDQIIVTVNSEKLQLWNRQGMLQIAIKTDWDKFTSINFTPDGKTIVSGNANGEIIFRNIADLEVDSLLSHGCSFLKDYLENKPAVLSSDAYGVKQRPLCSTQE
jgi:WD40 repeat protein